jgi:hypothetical protein
MITFTMRLPFYFIIAAGLASCVPGPHMAYRRPAVVGVIVKDKKPIPGIGLYLGKYPGENHPCTEVGDTIAVAADGRFSWQPIQERRFAESLISPVRLTGAITALCIRHPQNGISIGVMLFMRQDKPLTIRLACDVARPIPSSSGPHTFSALVGQSQYCEASEAD